MKTLIFGLFLFAVAAIASPALSSESIGTIHSVKGTASVHRGATTLPAAIGTSLLRGDLVRTGKPGAVGIVLTDDTTLSLGPNSELELKEYRFDPKAGSFSLVARMVKGSFSYLTGLIGKLAPGAVQLIIPDATIAVRGTKLLIDIQE